MNQTQAVEEMIQGVVLVIAVGADALIRRSQTHSSSRNTAYITVDTPDGKNTYTREQLDLTVGEALLVAPVFSEHSQVSFYLPRGTWTNLLTGEQVEGNTWRQEQHGYLSVPLYVCPNAIVALGQNENQPKYDYTDGVEFHVFELQDEHTASTIVYNQQGQPKLHMNIHRQKKRLSIRAKGVSKPCTILLRGIATITSAEGAQYSTSSLGVRIGLDVGVEYVEVVL